MISVFLTNDRLAWQCISMTKCLEPLLRSHPCIERAPGLAPAMFGDSKSWKCTAASERIQLMCQQPARFPEGGDVRVDDGFSSVTLPWSLKEKPCNATSI